MDLHVMSMMMEATAGWVKLLLVALQTRFWPRFDLWRSLTTRSLTTILGRVVLWGKYQVSSICRLPPSLFKTRKGSLIYDFFTWRVCVVRNWPQSGDSMIFFSDNRWLFCGPKAKSMITCGPLKPPTKLDWREGFLSLRRIWGRPSRPVGRGRRYAKIAGILGWRGQIWRRG